MPIISTIKTGIRETMAEPIRRFQFVFFSFSIFSLFILFPVWTTPGNDIAFQLSLLSPGLYALFIGLAVLNGFVIVMQWHAHRQEKHVSTGKREKTGLIGAVTASFFATIGCAACYSSVLAIFGLGGSLFILQHRWWFASIAIVLALVAIYYTARRIEGGCQVCSIEVDNKNE